MCRTLYIHIKAGYGHLCTPFTTLRPVVPPRQEAQKLFAVSFDEYLHRDADALEIGFEGISG